MAGAGTLVAKGRQVPVAYDLVQSPSASRFAAEGDVFGDAGALLEIYNSGPCDLLLETGRAVRAVLVICHLHGAAEVRITGPLEWR
jgi:hypothetical protein